MQQLSRKLSRANHEEAMILHSLAEFTRWMAISISEKKCGGIGKRFDELRTSLTFPILSEALGPLQGSTQDSLVEESAEECGILKHFLSNILSSGACQ